MAARTAQEIRRVLGFHVDHPAEVARTLAHPGATALHDDAFEQFGFDIDARAVAVLLEVLRHPVDAHQHILVVGEAADGDALAAGSWSTGDVDARQVTDEIEDVRGLRTRQVVEAEGVDGGARIERVARIGRAALVDDDFLDHRGGWRGATRVRALGGGRRRRRAEAADDEEQRGEHAAPTRGPRPVAAGHTDGL